MNILFTGADGQLGERLRKCVDHSSGDQDILTDINGLHVNGAGVAVCTGLT